MKGPWKIGFIEIAIISPYQQDLLTGMKQQFAKAKAKGLVSGSLLTSVPPTIAATTPEAQIAGGPADGPPGRQRDRHRADRRRPAGARDRCRRQGGHPGRSSRTSLCRGEVRRRGVDAEPDDIRRGHAQDRQPEGWRRRADGARNRGQPQRCRPLRPGDRRHEVLPEHPRRRLDLRQLGRGHGEDGRGAVPGRASRRVSRASSKTAA